MRALLCLSFFASSLSAADPAVKLLVPAYFYPGDTGLAQWDKLIAAGPKANIVAIANPDSGPGKRKDANYEKVLKRAADAKVGTVGYVTLGYAERPISAVKADVDSWLHFYPNIDGIFFDEQPSGAKLAPFAAEAFEYARGKFPKGHVFTNPGVNCSRDYFDAKGTATICAFEHKDEFELWEPTVWLLRDRCIALVYGVGKEKWRATFDRARKRARWVYVTDATANPWTRLPEYWDSLVAAAATPAE